jgi:condensin complex subunit 2
MPALAEVSVNKRINRRKSMLLLSDDEEEEDYDTALGNSKKNNMFDKEAFDNDDEGYLSPLKHGKENDVPKRKVDKSSAVKKTSNPKARKRRRSSARFLRLSGRFSTGGDIAEEDNDEENKEKLAEVYSKAIRLNAENKINAGNAWDLKLVENMDKLLGDDDEENHDDVPLVSTVNDDKRVNFTKASCTLDASVKIYSYRVDDVHLTSYKFLANLNRTDNGKDAKDDQAADRDSDLDDDNFDDGLHSKKKSYATRDGKSSTVKTIETNVGKFQNLTGF